MDTLDILQAGRIYWVTWHGFTGLLKYDYRCVQPRPKYKAELVQ